MAWNVLECVEKGEHTSCTGEMCTTAIALSHLCESSPHDCVLPCVQVHGIHQSTSLTLLVNLVFWCMLCNWYKVWFQRESMRYITWSCPNFQCLLWLKVGTCRKVISFQILSYFILEDFIFYWGHRFLHTKWLYKHVHSVHHECVPSLLIQQTHISQHYWCAWEFQFLVVHTKNFKICGILVQSLNWYPQHSWIIPMIPVTCVWGFWWIGAAGQWDAQIEQNTYGTYVTICEWFLLWWDAHQVCDTIWIDLRVCTPAWDSVSWVCYHLWTSHNWPSLVHPVDLDECAGAGDCWSSLWLWLPMEPVKTLSYLWRVQNFCLLPTSKNLLLIFRCT